MAAKKTGKFVSLADRDVQNLLKVGGFVWFSNHLLNVTCNFEAKTTKTIDRAEN